LKHSCHKNILGEKKTFWPKNSHQSGCIPKASPCIA
jgi:hypothetical protein